MKLKDKQQVKGSGRCLFLFLILSRVGVTLILYKLTPWQRIKALE